MFGATDVAVLTLEKLQGTEGAESAGVLETGSDALGPEGQVDVEGRRTAPCHCGKCCVLTMSRPLRHVASSL